VEVDAEERARVVWTRQQSVRYRQWTRQAIGEAVGEALTVDPMTVGEATTVQAWRRSRSERTGGREMIVAKVRV
jgi:hypothetical protein